MIRGVVMTALRARTAFLVAISLVMASCSSSVPAESDARPGESSGIALPPGGRTIEAAQVRMRDGARLNADVYLPAATGKFPIVLIRTPYKTELSSRNP